MDDRVNELRAVLVSMCKPLHMLAMDHEIDNLIAAVRNEPRANLRDDVVDAARRTCAEYENAVAHYDSMALRVIEQREALAALDAVAP